MEAGPAIEAPNAGKKKMPVPMIEFIVIRSNDLKFNTFCNSAIE